MSPWDLLQGVTESNFLISSQGLGHVTPNLGYLAKSAKCRVYCLGHKKSNTDETWCMGRSRTVVHDGKIFSHSQGQGRGNDGPNLTNLAPRQIDRLRPGQRRRMKFPYYETFEPFFHGAIEPIFFISSQGLGHMTTKMIELNQQNVKHRSRR